MQRFGYNFTTDRLGLTVIINKQYKHIHLALKYAIYQKPDQKSLYLSKSF